MQCIECCLYEMQKHTHLCAECIIKTNLPHYAIHMYTPTHISGGGRYEKLGGGLLWLYMHSAQSTLLLPP